MAPRRVSFGIKTSQMGLTYEEILTAWREADQIPYFEHAWLWDHMVPLRGDIRGAALEAWTLLSALAAQTSRLRLGVMVTSNRLRSPTLLAKMAATVDIIAGGRLDFGIGVGASRVEMENSGVREFEAYGVPLVSPGEAVRDLAESLLIIRRMWAEVEPFDFDGKSIQLTGAICEPKPLQKPHPPIVIGGAGTACSPELGRRVLGTDEAPELLRRTSPTTLPARTDRDGPALPRSLRVSAHEQDAADNDDLVRGERHLAHQVARHEAVRPLDANPFTRSRTQ